MPRARFGPVFCVGSARVDFEDCRRRKRKVSCFKIWNFCSFNFHFRVLCVGHCVCSPVHSFFGQFTFSLDKEVCRQADLRGKNVGARTKKLQRGLTHDQTRYAIPQRSAILDDQVTSKEGKVPLSLCRETNDHIGVPPSDVFRFHEICDLFTQDTQTTLLFATARYRNPRESRVQSPKVPQPLQQPCPK